MEVPPACNPHSLHRKFPLMVTPSPEDQSKADHSSGTDTATGGSDAAFSSARLIEINQQLIERDRALALARKRLEQLNQSVIERDRLATIAKSRIEGLLRERADLQRAFDGILTSRSWRLTAPIRRLFRPSTWFQKKSEPSWTDQPQSSSPNDRAETLERALEQVRSGTQANIREGTYIHRIYDYVDAERLDIKALAFYVPQSHAILETEARQPQLPDDFGFYDLRLPSVMRKQIELAKQYGIYGFCFHYYVLNGQRVLDQPLSQVLENSGLDIRFCVYWTNEVPSPGQPESSGTAEPQVCSPDEELAVIESLKSVFSDPRYIRIDDKPVFICRAEKVPDVPAAARRWRTRVAEMGFRGVYLVALGSPGYNDPASFSFDAILEDPFREGFSGIANSPSVTFKNVVAGGYEEHGTPSPFSGATPALYARWLNQCCQSTMLRPPEERVLFITTWNDWARGAHLEPDRRMGYAYLHATANVLRYYHNDSSTQALIENINATFRPTSKAAIILHCYYEDLVTPIFDQYLSRTRGADLFVTVRFDVSRDAIQEMRKRVPNIFFMRQENRGRDIRPFLFALRHIRSLGYSIACKVHTKKTPQAEHGVGELWREKLISPLLGSLDSVDRAVRLFSQEPDLGLLAPTGSVTDLRVQQHHSENTYWLDSMLDRMQRHDLVGKYMFTFPAGSMYWFRVEALAGFDDMLLEEDAFEYELGQRDGTLAHAAERLVALYAQQKGYSMKEVSEADTHSSDPRVHSAT
jgi:lipopolysaccharide biosynthesis protein